MSRISGSIARALAMEPEILLMDEPFGALDARTRDTLQAELVTIWRQTGKTILFVTHDMAEAVRLAGRVVVLRARPARVSQCVDVEALLPRPRTVDQPEVVALAAELKQDLEDNQELEAPDARQGRVYAAEDVSAPESVAGAGRDHAPLGPVDARH
jgi:NitT/TauT family transport system ATP-binding protein